MVDEAVVVDKLRLINEYTNDLKRMRGPSKADYLDDMVLQRAVERTFMNLIQACIDLAAHVRSTELEPTADTAKAEIDALEIAEIISSETADRLTEAVGFRNVLAHRYGDVNHDVVYEALHNDLRWFEQFQTEVAQWLQTDTT
ncbi:type VII toxin-antitoxin system HepT family RNase toxin [Halonotius sp. GCM10025705]|uniref:type VII toxin-antitoxin system HepT family RNase toxin n=1 Tax=Halonotius sp. GCM10025705 TaxID=3252678 RepID=UPI00361142A9